MENFIMSPPDYLRVVHEGNDRQKLSKQPDVKRAKREWANLYQVYEELGVKPRIIPPEKDCPELCFPGDSVFVCGEKIIRSNFNWLVRTVRMPETEIVEGWLKEKLGFLDENTYNLYNTLPYVCNKGLAFEGHAEALFWGDEIVFMGHGVRSDILISGYIQKILGVTVIPLQLKKPFFHLDLALLPLNKDTVIYCPEAFERNSQAVIKRIILHARTVTKEEAWERGGLNSVVVGRSVVLPEGAEETAGVLREEGFNPVFVDVSEFLDKTVGGVKCLTLKF